MGHVQKMILMVLTVPCALFPGGLIGYFLFLEMPQFEYTMLIPFGMTACGICAFYFHYRSKSFYKLFKADLPLPKIEHVFWFMTISFGMSFVVVSSYLHYMLTINTVPDRMSILIFTVPIFAVGLWTIVEAFYLHKLDKENRSKTRHLEIDEIKGQVRD